MKKISFGSFAFAMVLLMASFSSAFGAGQKTGALKPTPPLHKAPTFITPASKSTATKVSSGGSTTGADADDPTQDAFLAGYLTGALEQKFSWGRDSYRLQVQDGVATVILLQDDATRRAQVSDSFNTLDGLQGVNVVVDASSGPTTLPPVTVSSPTAPLVLRTGLTTFPVGDVFRPILADPKQPQFFMSGLRTHTPTQTFTAWTIGYGENFGLLRWPGKQPGEGWQLSLLAGIFAQFNWDAPSKDLINADYTFGIAQSYRKGFGSLRLRLYHQSSHLGDEFILNNHVDRKNVSYEAINAIGSLDWRFARVYGGGNYLLTHDPKDLKRGSTQYGLELISPVRLSFARPIAGIDIKNFQQNDFQRSLSVKAGFEIGKAGPGGRKLRILGEYYDGFSQYGQFYNEKVDTYGLGVYLGL